MLDVFTVTIGDKTYRLKADFDHMIAFEKEVMPIHKLVKLAVGDEGLTAEDIAKMVYTFWLDKPEFDQDKISLIKELQIATFDDGVIATLGALDQFMGAVVAGPKKLKAEAKAKAKPKTKAVEAMAMETPKEA